jgi:hypothetical protein
MPLISCVINVDTRPERNQNENMFKGVVSRDFLCDGIYNKKKFFAGFDFETIVFVDEHEPLTDKELAYLKAESDVLIIRKHNKKFQDMENFAPFNDLNYLNALFAARGTYVFHFDGDVAAFTNSAQPINNFIELLEKYDYVSYPSYWSPNPVHDESFGGKYWASTRFFCCKRKTMDFGELLKCQIDYDYWKTTYPVPRLCHWLEHLLSSIAWHKGNGVYYPPVDIENYAIFTWGSYEKYILNRLNSQEYSEVKAFILQNGGIVYPCDIHLR